MPNFMIQYRIKPDRKDEHEAAVHKFMKAEQINNDQNVKYESYQLPDGVSYVHIAWFSDDASKDKFQSTAHFDEFTEGLFERCEEGPDATPLTFVASSKKEG